ncbi:hypothetical protein BC830DRAFT_160736 [Chytriomyces sp. MP71]|nr:hypothetical protein BC830DRAFT_160736 [Chytriomyces sp. MP71]
MGFSVAEVEFAFRRYRALKAPISADEFSSLVPPYGLPAPIKGSKAALSKDKKTAKTTVPNGAASKVHVDARTEMPVFVEQLKLDWLLSRVGGCFISPLSHVCVVARHLNPGSRNRSFTRSSPRAGKSPLTCTCRSLRTGRHTRSRTASNVSSHPEPPIAPPPSYIHTRDPVLFTVLDYDADGAITAPDLSLVLANASHRVLAVGDRVRVRADRRAGTVRYLGETQFAPGVWAGIELDTPGGKHNGTVQGVKYFSCEAGKGVFLAFGAVEWEGHSFAAAEICNQIVGFVGSEGGACTYEKFREAILADSCYRTEIDTVQVGF